MSALEYLLGWNDGDNITITSDFVNYVEELNEKLGECIKLLKVEGKNTKGQVMEILNNLYVRG